MDSVLCSANGESMKFYFNEDEFGILPQDVRDTLRVMQVSYCADVGGIIIFSFDESGRLFIQSIDPIDEIGSELLIGRMQREYAELFAKLEAFAAGLSEIRAKAGDED